MTTFSVRLLAVCMTLLFSFAVAAQEEKKEKPPEPETLQKAFEEGEWSIKVDLQPRGGLMLIGITHEVPGLIVPKFKDDEFTARYSYSVIKGKLKGKFEGDILKCTFEEEGIVASTGTADFKIERDEKTGKITQLKGGWKVLKTDKPFQWLIVRDKEAPKEKPKEEEKK